jgi:hypothetical protein
MGWKDRFTFRERHFVEHEVCGQRLRFYPNRVGLLHDLAEVSKPVASALAALFSDRSQDAGMEEKISQQGDIIVKESVMQAVSAEIVTLRSKERDGAIDALLTAVSDPRNRLLLGRLLMDSLREEFPYHAERPAVDVEEFLYGDGKPDGYPGLDIPALTAMIGGWIKANAKQFGKVGEQVAAELAGRIGGVRVSPSPRSEYPSETPSPAPGSSSRTPSSEPSPAAST